MKNKKILKIIIIISIILLILLIYILSILKKENEKEEYEMQEAPQMSISVDVKKVESELTFFTVEECVNKYLSTLNNKEASIYNLLNEEYIKENKITEENVLDKINILKNGFEKFTARKMYFQEIDERQSKYYIYGEIYTADYSSIETIYIIANLDYENKTFDITPYKKTNTSEEEYSKIVNDLLQKNKQEFIYIDEETSNGISTNESNKFNNSNMQSKQILNYYIKDYVTMAVYYPEMAYNLLDEEYKKERFNSLEEYKQYINKNKNNLLNITIREYNITEKEGYTQYVIIDTEGNYYIFEITDIMKYSLKLDFYTIDVEEVISEYEGSNEQEKVAINIQKVVAALNAKNYSYIYSKLADKFKSNNYPSLQEFEKYMSETFTGEVILSFNKFTIEGETYIYNITLQGTTSINNTKINMQIIMKLKEEKDFVMSFNIK